MPFPTFGEVGAALLLFAETNVPVALVWKTLVKERAFATTDVVCPPAFVIVTVIVCAPAVGPARPNISTRALPLAAVPRAVMFCFGPPASLPNWTADVAVPPFRLIE